MEDAAQSPETSEDDNRKGRVLVVDDQEPIRRWLRLILESFGHIVVTAESVQTGVAALQGDFDVGVFDVDLPDGKGFELVEFARQKRALPLPVVMITGNPNDENVCGGLAHGITEFLFKPFEKHELKDAVDRALEIKQRWDKRLATIRDRGPDVSQEPESGAQERLEQGEVSQLLDDLRARAGLTDRETETLQLMLAGLQNVDIAEALSISANTVKYHVRNVLTKLGMESRTELFRSLLNRADD